MKLRVTNLKSKRIAQEVDQAIKCSEHGALHHGQCFLIDNSILGQVVQIRQSNGILAFVAINLNQRTRKSSGLGTGFRNKGGWKRERGGLKAD